MELYEIYIYIYILEILGHISEIVRNHTGNYKKLIEDFEEFEIVLFIGADSFQIMSSE
jgi:hypothetical protein